MYCQSYSTTALSVIHDQLSDSEKQCTNELTYTQAISARRISFLKRSTLEKRVIEVCTIRTSESGPLSAPGHWNVTNSWQRL